MKTDEITREIQQIIETFGMKAEVCAKAMNITTQTFRCKLSDKNERHRFTEKNLEDLRFFIKNEAKNL